MSDNGASLKGAAPLERATIPAGGFFDKKKIAMLALGVVGIGGLAAWGMSIQGEEVEEVKVSEVKAANINVDAARSRIVLNDPVEEPQDNGPGPIASEPSKGDATPKPKGPPEGWQKISPVVMRGNRTQGVQQTAQAHQGPQGGRQQMAQAGGGQPMGDSGADYGDDYGNGRDMQRRSNKQSFYAGGGASVGGQSLDIAGELLPELSGCILKAGTYIPLQNRSQVRTALPAHVLGYVYQAVEGNHYLGNGQVERCIAIPALSTVLSEVNAAGVERGDLRIQACALRIDLNGGGRRPLGCQPAHGADGGAGIEAESDYQVSGIATGILIEAALASVRGLTGLIAGPAGIAVQVGANGISDVGSQYVQNELMKPPVLTMKAGATWGIQLNGDLSFPLID
jgi:hypothetical protein